MVEKICEKRCDVSWEWKSEGVMDDDSGDSEGEEDWLRQGWLSAAFMNCESVKCIILKFLVTFLIGINFKLERNVVIK